MAMNLRSSLLLSTLAAGYLTLTVPFGSAVARDSTLTPEQIAGFQQRVTQAQATKESIGTREVCLKNYMQDLQKRSDGREIDLGESRRREQQYASAVSQNEGLQKSLSAAAGAEKKNFDKKQVEYKSAMKEQNAQDIRLKDCKKAMTFLSGLCKVGDEAVRKMGLMRNVQAEIAGIQQRLGNAQNALREAQRKLGESQSALAQARGQAASNQAAIRQLEGEIVNVKSTIANLHVTIQSYNDIVDEFVSMIGEAGTVDTDSPRARQIIRLSSEVDGLISRAPAAIGLADSVLPEGMRQNCSPR